ncbi:MAG: CPBP family intramembrane metalloprotease [Firmicutes bacterium]|nr:CPBP family intramembrane metalloprotease [Bacillota bacterium]
MIVKKIFEKHETLFCMLLIVFYIVINSFCIQNFGLVDYRSVIINTIYSFLLILLMVFLKRTRYYGLIKVTNINKYLYFIPLLLIVSVNLWNGININNSISEMIFYILNMINVGFIEEIIFRGFLFKMLAKDNIKSAIIISALTFGIGHIFNLFNGAELFPTLMQICYAISIGYLFAIIFYKSKSLIPCIITHCLVNSLSIFNVENSTPLYISELFLIIVPVVYAIYINKTIR